MTISKKAFVAWLKKQPKDRSFNMNNGGLCMLAEHLTELHGKDVSMWGTMTYVIEDQEYGCPPWAEQFQKWAIKNERFRGEDRFSMGAEFPMTPKEALELLGA